MNTFEKIFYYLRLLFLIISLFLTFLLIQNITQVGIIGYFYLIIFIIFVLLTIKDVLMQNKSNKKDIIYSSMQIGYVLYLGVVVFKTYYDKIVVMDNTINYFRINYFILSILLIIIALYKIYDNKEKNKNY